MKTHLTKLAGLALAATIMSTFAQDAAPPPPSAGFERAEKPLPPGRPPKGARGQQIEAQDQFELAQRAARDGDGRIREVFNMRTENIEHPLIVSASQLDEKALASLDEDITVMARILDKSVDRGSDDLEHKAMGIHLWALGQGNRGARNLYIEGYGAVFILNVSMPLQAPAMKANADEKKEPVNSTWEEARNEVFGREDDPRYNKHDRKPPQFDSARLEGLKKSLTEALKNATHIRGLKESDHVTIVVQGPGHDRITHRVVRADGGKGEVVTEDVFGYAFAGPGSGGGARTIMTLRAKKSDIDAFAKNKNDLDDFRKKVAVSIYQSPAGGGQPGAQVRGF